MITLREAVFLSICVQGFFYGLYSGIFAIYYIQCSMKESRTIIIFYAICLLYVLSTVLFVCDWVNLILENGIVLRIRTLHLQAQMESEPMLLRLYIARAIVNGCCDFVAQCILIYRCWIVWGQNIRVVIIPSFLAIAFLATWLAPSGAAISAQFVQGLNWIDYYSQVWEAPVVLTSIVTSLAVNALVTGLIVFKILKVFLGVQPTSVERTLGSKGGTTGRLQHVIFVIIESGMALFAIQLVRVLFVTGAVPLPSPPNLFDFIAVINQMLNGIAPTIIWVRVSMRLSFDDEESFKEAVESLRFNNPPCDPDTHRRMGTFGSSSSLPPEDSENVV